MLLDPPELTTSSRIGAGRVILVVEYDGTRYHGWQAQKSGLPTIEGGLRKAIEAVADHPVELVCAGRTDAGVHATHQVVHFDTRSIRSFRSWILGINSALPDDICVHWAGNAPEGFHARFSAIGRRYRYLIVNHPVRPALMRMTATWQHRPLDSAAMHEAAQFLVGEHDFSAFRAAGCQSRSPVRRIERVTVTRAELFVVIDVQANAFLHHMVRNIAGTLMRVGAGQENVPWVREVLEARDRRLSGVTAPASGLYLVGVDYPASMPLPETAPGPAFLRPWPELLG